MEKLSYQELKEIFELMKESGLKPTMCDTPVPYFDAGIQSGVPTYNGESTRGEFVNLPKEMVESGLVVMAKVKGDSMKDAGIYSGDRIQVELGSSVYEGDIVVASIDGECTVKAYCIDEMNCPWLVPRNDAYNAIPLTDDKKVRIIGKVLEIIRDAPRTSHNEMLKCIKRTRGKVNAEERKITPERIHDIIYEMGEVVKHGRQWYAVYRAMVDKEVLEDGNYTDFCESVTTLLPDHGHLPVPGELRRMAVQTFRKSPTLWERGDAPVSGQRFDDYLRIANLTAEKLRK